MTLRRAGQKRGVVLLTRSKEDECPSVSLDLSCDSSSFDSDDSVRRNHETRGSSDHDIETVMKQWFRTAGDRDGGRRRRTAPAAAPAQLP